MTETSRPAQALAEHAADRIIGINEEVDRLRPEFARLYSELLNTPSRRNVAIEERYIGYLMEQSVLELGNDSMAQYWQTVADMMDVSWDQLNSIPTNERGDLFQTTRNVLSAVCYEQAFIECCLALVCVESGIDSGTAARELAGRVKNLTDYAESDRINNLISKKLEERKNE